MLYITKSDLDNKPLTPPDWYAYFERRKATSSHPVINTFYRQALPDHSLSVDAVPLVALDLETTGLNPGHDSIVSVGLVEFSTSRVRINSARYWVVRPLRPLTEESILIHNLTHSDVASAPPLTKVLSELVPLLTGKIVVAHHTAIERHFLLQAAERIFNEAWLFPMIDTLALERQLTMQSQSWWQRWTRPRPSLQLRDCRTRYGLPAYRQHHALTDAIACAELFQAQISRTGADTRLHSVWS